MSTTGVLPAGDVAKESGKRSAEHAARRVEQEDGIRMKRRRGEETRTDIIWRTVGLPALIPRD